jgi:hypothetical protein
MSIFKKNISQEELDKIIAEKIEHAINEKKVMELESKKAVPLTDKKYLMSIILDDALNIRKMAALSPLSREERDSFVERQIKYFKELASHDLTITERIYVKQGIATLDIVRKMPVRK